MMSLYQDSPHPLHTRGGLITGDVFSICYNEGMFIYLSLRKISDLDFDYLG